MLGFILSHCIVKIITLWNFNQQKIRITRIFGLKILISKMHTLHQCGIGDKYW